MVPTSAGFNCGQEHAAVVRRALHRLRHNDNIRCVSNFRLFRERSADTSSSGIVIDQAVKGGFRFRTVDEIAEKRHEIEAQQPPSPSSPVEKSESEQEDKKDPAIEYIDTI